MSDGPCCSHLNVCYRTEDFRLSALEAEEINRRAPPSDIYPPIHAGMLMTRGWWQCRDCDTKFTPVGQTEKP